MSTETTVTTTIEANPVVEEALSRAERKKQFISILERGIIDDRLKVPNLPDHLHPQWVRKDQFSIDRMKSLGFWIDDKYAVERSLHSDGTKTAQVADVILMLCKKEDYEILQEIQQDEFVRNHGKPGQTGKTNREEREFEAALQAETGGDIPAINEGQNRAVRAAELAATMDKLRSQGG